MKKSNEAINVIVPFGYSSAQPERENLLHFVAKNCLQKQTANNLILILIEVGSEPTQENFARTNFDQYIFAPRDGIFSTGFAQNLGFIHSTESRYTYIHQPDFLLETESIEMSLDQIKTLDCPFVFPFYSAINLSKPLTQFILNGQIDLTSFTQIINKVNINLYQSADDVPRRYRLSDQELNDIDQVLPSNENTYNLSIRSTEEIWGKNDGTFTYFPDFFEVSGRSDTLVNYRPKPKAAGSYLALSDAYSQIGGVQEFVGWGYEDLFFWQTVKTVYGYELIDGIIKLKGKTISRPEALIHLWHAVNGRPDYFQHVEQNKQAYETLCATLKEEIVRNIIPLTKLGAN